MKIAKIYNHLNGQEYMHVHAQKEWNEIKSVIKSIDANNCTKRNKSGKTLYDQKKLNNEFREKLNALKWKSFSIHYYVADDIDIEKEIVGITKSETQKEYIVASGHNAINTSNQVDFKKDKIAIEVQFGKYFSVAYDLHVKHTFFYLRGEIDVGIEIIPTHQMHLKMDNGVPWFEKEVANIIREGRSNPPVPIIIIGIEPKKIII